MRCRNSGTKLKSTSYVPGNKRHQGSTREVLFGCEERGSIVGTERKWNQNGNLEQGTKITGNFKFGSLAVGRAQAKTRRAHTCNKLSGPVQEKSLIFMSFKPTVKYGLPGMTCSDNKFILSLSITGGCNQEVSRKGITVGDHTTLWVRKGTVWGP